MNSNRLTSDQDPAQDPMATGTEAPQIAIQERLVLVMFLVVGGLFGIVLLVDLFFGFFR